jgi:hypothetical protein
MMTKEDYTILMFDLMERVGADALIHEFILYSSNHELENFISHCEGMWPVEELELDF